MRSIFATLILIGYCYNSQAQMTSDSRAFDGALDGRHSLALTPFSAIVAYNKFNPAIGFEYEYIFNQEAGIGIRLPLAFGYAGPEQDFNGNYKHTTVYAAPGIRFHGPVGSRRSVEFATGPAILIGNMHFKPYDGYYGGGSVVAEPFNYGMLGLMADNSINFYRNHFQFGLDVRVGALAEVRDDTRFFIHFGMHFGGKF